MYTKLLTREPSVAWSFSDKRQPTQLTEMLNQNFKRSRSLYKIGYTDNHTQIEITTLCLY